MDSSSINVGLADIRERKRRKRDLIFVLGAAVLFVVLSWAGLKYFSTNSFVFLGLFNLNLILLLLILFLVVRNAVKLVLERKRKVLGARLRSKLVLAFIFLSLCPTIPMFFVSMKVVQTSVDYWFKSQVESSMEQALEVGQAFYQNTQEGLERKGKNIIERIRKLEYAWGGSGMDAFLKEKRAEYDLTLLGVINPEGKEQNWHAAEEWKQAWPQIKNKVDWQHLNQEPAYWSAFWPGPDSDLVVGLVPVDNAQTGFLILGSRIGQGFLYKLDQIVRGVEEYKKLKTLKYPLQIVLYLFLGVLTLLIIFGAMWIGFRMAKEISAPIQALAVGTERIAKGDLGVRLKDESADELGFLVQSFNRMAEDLEKSQERLTQANLRLAQQYEKLEERGQYTEAVLNNITAGVISLDNKGKINTVNKAAEAMLGIDSKQLIGIDPMQLVRGPYRDMIKDMLDQLQENPGSQWQRQVEIKLRNKDLKLLVNAVVLHRTEGDEAGLVAVFEDITELEKMQRMAAWREVARRIAHEIKNPLTPIKLSAQRLEQKFSPMVEDKVFSQCTGLIVRQVEHLQEMVKEFSSFAKLPEVKLEENYLAPLLEEVVDLFKNSHSTISWELVFETKIPATRFDREGIRRALINVLTNAVEALEEREDGRISIVARHHGELERIQVEVIDNGYGLNPEEESRLFEPYYSKKKGGTGLGLTIVKSIVSDHQGYIRVESLEGGGTKFVMEIPVKS